MNEFEILQNASYQKIRDRMAMAVLFCEAKKKPTLNQAYWYGVALGCYDNLIDLKMNINEVEELYRRVAKTEIATLMSDNDTFIAEDLPDIVESEVH